MADRKHPARDPELRKQIAWRMRRARENTGLTIKAAAQALGITPSSVTYWESGSKFPKVEHLNAILSLYRVSADDLLARTSPEEFQRELLLAGARGMDRRQRRALAHEMLAEELG